VIDALGRPKAPWYALRRIFDPLTAYVCDNGLEGYSLHAFNDTPERVPASIEIALYGQSTIPLERVSVERELSPHSQHSVDFSEIFEGFRDLSYAFRFGQVVVEAIQITMTTSDNAPTQFVALPGGLRRERERSIGLVATAASRDGHWEMTVKTRDLAHYVAIDVPGFVPDDCWFHLAPGTERTVHLHPNGHRTTPTGFVRALNTREEVGIEITN
jgi:beta-mannosidase